ncbi:hypothetical protein Tco_0564368 [Tanacetum coccineum]
MSFSMTWRRQIGSFLATGLSPLLLVWISFRIFPFSLFHYAVAVFGFDFSLEALELESLLSSNASLTRRSGILLYVDSKTITMPMDLSDLSRVRALTLPQILISPNSLEQSPLSYLSSLVELLLLIIPTSETLSHQQYLPQYVLMLSLDEDSYLRDGSEESEDDPNDLTEDDLRITLSSRGYRIGGVWWCMSGNDGSEGLCSAGSDSLSASESSEHKKGETNDKSGTGGKES